MIIRPSKNKDATSWRERLWSMVSEICLKWAGQPRTRRGHSTSRLGWPLLWFTKTAVGRTGLDKSVTSAQFLWTDAHPLKLTLLLTVSVTEPKAGRDKVMLCCLYLLQMLLQGHGSWQASPGFLQVGCREVITVEAGWFALFTGRGVLGERWAIYRIVFKCKRCILIFIATWIVNCKRSTFIDEEAGTRGK